MTRVKLFLWAGLLGTGASVPAWYAVCQPRPPQTLAALAGSAAAASRSVCERNAPRTVALARLLTGRSVFPQPRTRDRPVNNPRVRDFFNLARGRPRQATGSRPLPGRDSPCAAPAQAAGEGPPLCDRAG